MSTEVKIGFKDTLKELVLYTDLPVEDIKAQFISPQDKAGSFIELTDVKGKIHLIALPSVINIEIGSQESRRVGFSVQ